MHIYIAVWRYVYGCVYYSIFIHGGGSFTPKIRKGISFPSEKTGL